MVDVASEVEPLYGHLASDVLFSSQRMVFTYRTKQSWHSGKHGTNEEQTYHNIGAFGVITEDVVYLGEFAVSQGLLCGGDCVPVESDGQGEGVAVVSR